MLLRRNSNSSNNNNNRATAVLRVYGSLPVVVYLHAVRHGHVGRPCRRTHADIDLLIVYIDRLDSCFVKSTNESTETFLFGYSALFIYLFNINLVQEYTQRKGKNINEHKSITVETKLYTVVSQSYQQHRPY